MLDVVSHLEQWWSIICWWWLPLRFNHLALIATWEFAEGIVHSLIISVGTIWSKWWVLLVDIQRRWWLFLFRQLLVSNWANNIHWVIEGTMVISLSILSLP